MKKRTFLKQCLKISAVAMVTPHLSLKAMENFDSDNNENEIIKAKYFESLPDNNVKCALCAHKCLLKNGQNGICRTRINKNGTLYTVAYGNPIAIHIDPIEKKPLYHFLPSSKVLSFGTAGCNFRCLNCQNDSISQTSPENLSSLNFSPQKIVDLAIEHKSDGIAFTYTEPTVFYEYMLDTAKLAKQAGLTTMAISNGFINEKPLLELIDFVDAFNIDLKAFDENIYKTLCGAKLEPVLNTIKTIKNSGKWLEITNLMVTGYTDNLDNFQKMIDWLIANKCDDTPLHISRFFPAYKLSNTQATDINIIEQAFNIAKKSGIKYVYTGNLHNNSHENTFCHNCGSLLISRNRYSTKIENLKGNKCGKCETQIPGIWIK
ncbi:MAG: AmmeMemoRadiSam system radical SAM enzyme [Bacteroidales bacterium]|nr:AmmeMemoRadiSam system radical SAM enzyme [Bacteroidales bacterium]